MKILSLIFIALAILPLTASNSISYSQQPVVGQMDPLFSGLHTLSIHIRDSAIHDSVFHFLTKKLKLPVYYYPLKMGVRRYAGVYAGNLVLESCGPYSNFSYASSNFRAIFFGLTFEPYKTLKLSAAELAGRNIDYSVDGDVFIYPKDPMLCGDNMTISIMDKPDKISDRQKLDSLRYSMENDNNGDLGIEYVKEIWMGYKELSGLNKWKDLIKPSVLNDNEIWSDSNIPEIRFKKSNIKEVQAIVFKVRSLEKAKGYFSENGLNCKVYDNKIELDKSQTFGLSIYFSE